jgi:hypothetical protein
MCLLNALYTISNLIEMEVDMFINFRFHYLFIQ